ncbi:hypothetical protein RFI_16716 [Reticulomyxa filosa]|uniref:Uncharacterized protein n=1 Tax=Reticulomyxa filosa TaxID=46433 RepID=X6N430_RETFI|nr:hypothetical protein RFI_16716 [Reticulomyxa filosa]|eukprot:ETO20499.1 hypothetical protein RFI_16716 [Reticulomyxa filosa]
MGQTTSDIALNGQATGLGSPRDDEDKARNKEKKEQEAGTNEQESKDENKKKETTKEVKTSPLSKKKSSSKRAGGPEITQTPQNKRRRKDESRDAQRSNEDNAFTLTTETKGKSDEDTKDESAFANKEHAHDDCGDDCYQVPLQDKTPFRNQFHAISEVAYRYPKKFRQGGGIF